MQALRSSPMPPAAVTLLQEAWASRMHTAAPRLCPAALDGYLRVLDRQEGDEVLQLLRVEGLAPRIHERVDAILFGCRRRVRVAVPMPDIVPALMAV